MTEAVHNQGTLTIRKVNSQEELCDMLKQYGTEDHGFWKVITGGTWILKGFGHYSADTDAFLDIMDKRRMAYARA